MKTFEHPSAPAQAGFTLIELMVTVVIATILISIAIPAYTNQVQKGRRTDAKTALLDLASREERFFSANNTYSQTASDLGYGPVGTPFPITINSGYYSVNVTTVAAVVTAGNPPQPAQYTITATPLGTQANDANCATFSLDQSGKQTATGSATASADCWH
jgi:type IV pilus assembly protein PilE